MEETIHIEETIRKVSAIFDKMASVKITPTSNYSIPEYWMNRAIKGDEKCKNNLFNWITIVLNIDKSILNAVFNAKYNRTNENKVMNRKLIRLTESDLHRIVNKSVNKVLRETLEPAYPNSNSTDVSEIAGELYERINDCFLRDRGDSDWDFEIEQAAQENPKEIYHLLADLQNFLEMIYNKHINN